MLATTAAVVPFVTVASAQVGPPVAACEVSEPFAEPDETVTLDASGSSDPDGRIVFWEFDADGDGVDDRASETDGTIERYEWFLDGNETAAATGVRATLSFPVERSYDVTLVVTDDCGATDALTDAVGVGAALPADNESPRVDFSFVPALPTAGDRVTFTANASDPDGTDVAVAAGEGGGFALAYLESEDGRNGSVVRGRVEVGVFAAGERFAATRVAGVAVAARWLAWTDGSAADRTVHYVRDGTPVVVPTDATDLRDVDLFVDGGRPVVTYRGRPPTVASVDGTPGGSGPGYDLYYRLRGDDGTWLPERRLAGDAGTGLTFGGTGYAAGPEGFVAVFGARNVSSEDNPDPFAVTHRFGPDLSVTASATPGAPLSVGANVTLSVTVRNAGDLPTSRGTALVVSGGAGSVATLPVGRLGVGEATTW